MNVLGPRIRIRPTRHQDLMFLQSLWDDGTVMRYKGYPNGMHISQECMERWWSTTPQSQQSELSFSSLANPHCLIELQENSPIGEFSYSLDANQRARVDLKLAREFWGHGYATEAMIISLRELFATRDITYVVVDIPTGNLPAQQLSRRCGFHPAPTENHPNRWECTRRDFADRDNISLAEVA